MEKVKKDLKDWNKKADEAINKMNPPPIKKTVDRKDYLKEYAKKQATIKISKECHEIAKDNAKHHHRKMRGYIEYLIMKDRQEIENK